MYFGVGSLRQVLQQHFNLHCFESLTSKSRISIYKSHLHNVISLRRDMGKIKNLAAFDFDHTIVDDNTDIVARNLLQKDSIPETVKKLYKNDGWTAYMQAIFELLHLQGKTREDIVNVISDIPATKGMPELIKDLVDNNYDVIIISDSNSFLIDAWLQAHNLKDKILQVYTNPAKFVNGVLRVEMYHLQTCCQLSTKNLCKGQILDDFIDLRKEEGIEYDKIVYLGDGKNDVCPILRLRDSDLACVRNNYSCLKIIDSIKNGKPFPGTGLRYNIKSDVLIWETGFDVLDKVHVK